MFIRRRVNEFNIYKKILLTSYKLQLKLKTKIYEIYISL